MKARGLGPVTCPRVHPPSTLFSTPPPPHITTQYLDIGLTRQRCQSIYREEKRASVGGSSSRLKSIDRSGDNQVAGVKRSFATLPNFVVTSGQKIRNKKEKEKVFYRVPAIAGVVGTTTPYLDDTTLLANAS